MSPFQSETSSVDNRAFADAENFDDIEECEFKRFDYISSIIFEELIKTSLKYFLEVVLPDLKNEEDAADSTSSILHSLDISNSDDGDSNKIEEHVVLGGVDENKVKEANTKKAAILSEEIRGLVANVPDRIQEVTRAAISHFWKLKQQCSGRTFEQILRENTQIEELSVDILDQNDFIFAEKEEKVNFVSKKLIFDYIRELLLRIYEGEDDEKQTKTSPKITSSQYHLWKAPWRPYTLQHLIRVVQQNLIDELRLRFEENEDPDKFAYQISRMSKLAQWTLSRKSSLDKLLELEMRSDEPNWLNYLQYEAEIKESLIDTIFRELLDYTFSMVLEEDVAIESRSRNPSSVISFA